MVHFGGRGYEVWTPDLVGDRHGTQLVDRGMPQDRLGVSGGYLGGRWDARFLGSIFYMRKPQTELSLRIAR